MYKIGNTAYYTVQDVAEKTGLARQTIDRYIKNREIKPPVERHHGKRKVRTYSKADFNTVLNQIKNFSQDKDGNQSA